MDAATLEQDAVKFAQLAVQRDQGGRYQEAVFYYKVSGREAALLPLLFALPPLGPRGGGPLLPVSSPAPQ